MWLFLTQVGRIYTVMYSQKSQELWEADLLRNQGKSLAKAKLQERLLVPSPLDGTLGYYPSAPVSAALLTCLHAAESARLRHFLPHH